MPDLIEFTRLYLAIFYSLVAAFYTVRIIRMKRANAKEVVYPGERFCITWWNHLAFRFFRAAIWLVCLLRLFFPELDTYLGMMTNLHLPAVIIPGLVILSIGFIATATIHYRLGKEWRSGIDPRGPKNIITRGIYQYSRNPMFVFVAMAQLGFFLAMPSLFSAICLLIGLYTLNSQAKAEEKHLLQTFPKEYALYSSRVRRWL